MIFKDRREAGEKLADALTAYKDAAETIVLGLPRGGVVVAAPVAQKLHLPLDIVVARKIGAPQNEEMAIGAVTKDGAVVLNEEIIETLEIDQNYIKNKIQEGTQEARRRFELYRHGRPALNLISKKVILVDDGLATGLTMKAAILEIKRQNPAKIIVAVPVAAAETAEQFRRAVDEVVVLDVPDEFGAVGAFYENFEQTTDKEVITILK